MPERPYDHGVVRGHDVVNGPYTNIPLPLPNENPQGRFLHYGGPPTWQPQSPFGYDDGKKPNPRHVTTASRYWDAAGRPEVAQQTRSSLTPGQRRMAEGVSPQTVIAASASLRSPAAENVIASSHLVNANKDPFSSPDYSEVQARRVVTQPLSTARNRGGTSAGR